MTNWTTIYKTYHEKLLTTAFRMLNDRQLAQDIVRDVFLTLLEKNISPIFMTDAKSYLLKSVRNRCISHLRKKACSVSIDEWHNSLIDNRTLNTIAFRELSKQYHQAITTLPPKGKKVTVLQLELGLTKKEIAVKMDISVGVVKDHLQSSKRKIRSRLDALRA